jgi:hypothetical protein
MHRVLVVANQTIGGRELGEELRKRIQAGQCSFYVLVPNTAARNYHVVPAAGGMVPMPAIAAYAGPATDEEATDEARYRLKQVLAQLSDMGAQADGHLGTADPVKAVQDTLADRQFDEVIVATLPRRVSRWLGSDVPDQIQRRYGLPVTTVVSRG